MKGLTFLASGISFYFYLLAGIICDKIMSVWLLNWLPHSDVCLPPCLALMSTFLWNFREFRIASCHHKPQQPPTASPMHINFGDLPMDLYQLYALIPLHTLQGFLNFHKFILINEYELKLYHTFLCNELKLVETFHKDILSVQLVLSFTFLLVSAYFLKEKKNSKIEMTTFLFHSADFTIITVFAWYPSILMHCVLVSFQNISLWWCSDSGLSSWLDRPEVTGEA